MLDIGGAGLWIKKLIINTKNIDNYLTTTIRLDKNILDKYDDIAYKTNHSRNELMVLALKFALDYMEIEGYNKNIE